MNVFSKNTDIVHMGMRVVFLLNSNGSLKFYIPKPYDSVLMAGHEQVGSLKVEQ